jgi:putative NADH-flavin reductase
MKMAVNTIGIIGATGMTGSYVALELLKRGYKVVGISRNPQKLGQHEDYTTRSIDLTKASIPEVADTLKSLDAVINAYGPHSQMGEAVGYSECW